ncbi:hypothetical protein H2203_002165 [Taxawa tesnikishii (nom. ined.)]|nr:hypothetical protein H2203_002165 [Dothideales sp. JES 119]
MSDPAALTTAQSSALLDLLAHHETYDEIEDFKSPHAIHNYGTPFQDNIEQSASPILHSLLNRFVLRLPGLRDISPDFWKVRVQNIIEELSAAELSESYDKGILGIRKTLATAVSALIEYPARGMLGAFPKDPAAFEEREYDKTKGDDVLQAFHAFLQQLVYGQLFDYMYKKAAETDDLNQHTSLVQAAHEFVVIK